MPIERIEIEKEEPLRPVDLSQSRTNESALLIDVILAFLKRPWILLISIFAISVPGVMYLFSLPEVYQSKAVISTPQGSTLSSMGLDPIVSGGVRGRDENYYISILESNAYYQRVADAVLEARPELRPASDSINSLVRSAVTYSKKPRSIGFFAITATARTPEFSKFLADKAVKAFESITIDLRRRETNLVAVFVEKQIESLNNSLADNEANIQSFIEKRNLGYGDMAVGVDAELRKLQQKLGQAETERDLAQLQIETYTTQLNDHVSSFLLKSEDPDESQQLRELNIELNRLTALSADSSIQRDSLRFAAIQNDRQDVLHRLAYLVSSQNQSSPEGKSRQASVKSIENALQESFFTHGSAQIRFAYFQAAIENFVRENPDLPKDILEYFNLTRTKNVLQKTIDILVEMREKTRIQLASETGGIEVIDYPIMPTSPIGQRRGMKSLLIIAISIFLGFAVSYVVDRFDNTVQGEADLQNRFNLPIYGSIPVLDSDTNRRSYSYSKRRDHKPKLETGADPKRLNYYSESSPTAEAYHAIKTAIEFTKRDNGSKSFVITSPVASDGKSLTTFNLAIAFARSGTKVLIIDADLRRASQHKLFECPRTPGFTDLMHGKNTFEDCLVKGPVDGVSFMPAGAHVSNPAALLSSHFVREFLDYVEPKFDLILIDTPPITPCMDSRHLALNVGGGLILVVRAEKTKLNILEHSLNLLIRSGVQVLGVIVNHASMRYGYGYYYMYQYYNPYGYYYSGYHYYYHQDTETGERVKKKRRKSSSEGKETNSSNRSRPPEFE